MSNFNHYPCQAGHAGICLSKIYGAIAAAVLLLGGLLSCSEVFASTLGYRMFNDGMLGGPGQCQDISMSGRQDLAPRNNLDVIADQTCRQKYGPTRLERYQKNPKSKEAKTIMADLAADDVLGLEMMKGVYLATEKPGERAQEAKTQQTKTQKIYDAFMQIQKMVSDRYKRMIDDGVPHDKAIENIADILRRNDVRSIGVESLNEGADPIMKEAWAAAYGQ